MAEESPVAAILNGATEEEVEIIKRRRKDILNAATKGDVELLRNACNHVLGLLTPYLLGWEDTRSRNLLHAAAQSNHYACLFKALTIAKEQPVGATLVVALICQQETQSRQNPLHYAAKNGNIFTVKLLVNEYTRAVAGLAAANANNQNHTFPWLMISSHHFTPLRASLMSRKIPHEDVARYLALLDQHPLTGNGEGNARYSTRILDDHQASIVFVGMQKGYSRLVEEILSSDIPYSVQGSYVGENPLHYAFKCSEEVSKLLLRKHPELIGMMSARGESGLDRAVKNRATWLVKLMVEEEDQQPWVKACRRLIWHQNDEGNTPLHFAAEIGNTDIAELLIQGYRSAIRDEATEGDEAEVQANNSDFLGVIPTYIKNSRHYVPLVVALKNKNDACGVMLAEETFPIPEYYVGRGLHKEALLAAAENACPQSVKEILARIITFNSNFCQSCSDRLELFHPVFFRSSNT